MQVKLEKDAMGTRGSSLMYSSISPPSVYFKNLFLSPSCFFSYRLLLVLLHPVSPLFQASRRNKTAGRALLLSRKPEPNSLSLTSAGRRPNHIPLVMGLCHRISVISQPPSCVTRLHLRCLLLFHFPHLQYPISLMLRNPLKKKSQIFLWVTQQNPQNKLSYKVLNSEALGHYGMSVKYIWEMVKNNGTYEKKVTKCDVGFAAARIKLVTHEERHHTLIAPPPPPATPPPTPYHPQPNHDTADPATPATLPASFLQDGCHHCTLMGTLAYQESCPKQSHLTATTRIPQLLHQAEEHL
ncbi:hypothetical protein E2C01_039917 [Portunus trituberculatus]|uniref:Uncharacterized protein n=1 Tax=Portunus trituberculatus TaxID=210409 RepID=A0A5B7FPB4_PORTR|nr:hypothetical protein [Portunus trituberculatus]